MTIDMHGTRLAGKVAIVTGAGHEGDVPGTGVAIARLFAAQAARVAVVDISEPRAQNTVDVIERDGGKSFKAVGDISVDGDCVRIVSEVIDRYGRVDVLVNNVAIATGGSVIDVDEAAWDRVLDINLKSVMLMSKHVVPRLVDARGGSVINISSIAAFRGFGTVAYAASKGGVIAMTTDMAYSHGRDGVRVNCIAPGHIFTPMGDQGGPHLRDARRRAGVLGIEGDASDVAWAAVFLASDESRWITGVTLPVDAGATAVTALAMRDHMTS